MCGIPTAYASPAATLAAKSWPVCDERKELQPKMAMMMVVMMMVVAVVAAAVAAVMVVMMATMTKVLMMSVQNLQSSQTAAQPTAHRCRWCAQQMQECPRTNRTCGEIE